VQLAGSTNSWVGGSDADAAESIYPEPFTPTSRASGEKSQTAIIVGMIDILCSYSCANRPTAGIKTDRFPVIVSGVYILYS
jgi:hypothetical protein